VATKSRKKVNMVVHLTRDASLKLIDSQRAIWLAGLGALAKVTTTTGTKGEQAFEALIKAGEKLESQARGAIDTNADLLKLKINDASKVVDEGIDTVGDAFDARVKQALARLGYPKPRLATK
jgi:poly(hydroxyalkanoate) granule-associated protein